MASEEYYTTSTGYLIPAEYCVGFWDIASTDAYFGRRNVYARFRGKTRGFAAGTFDDAAVPRWARLVLWLRTTLSRRQHALVRGSKRSGI